MKFSIKVCLAALATSVAFPARARSIPVGGDAAATVALDAVSGADAEIALYWLLWLSTKS